MPTNVVRGVRIPRPALIGALCGIAVSLGIMLLDILPAAQGHALLVAAIATPYLAFALIDGSARSLVVEITVTVAFVTTAFLVFDASAWVVAIALIAHGLWDLVHLRIHITNHLGDYPVWCGTLDITAAAALLITSA